MEIRKPDAYRRLEKCDDGTQRACARIQKRRNRTYSTTCTGAGETTHPIMSIKEMSTEDVKTRLSELQLDSFEMIAEFETGTKEAFGFKVRTSADQETVIGYHPESSELFVDRTRSGLSDFHKEFTGRHAVKLEAANGRMRLHLFVDRSSVEVFADDGEQS